MFRCGVCRDSIRQSAGQPIDRDVSRVDSGRFPIFDASYAQGTCSSCPMRSMRDVQNRTWIQIRSVLVPPAIASVLDESLADRKSYSTEIIRASNHQNQIHSKDGPQNRNRDENINLKQVKHECHFRGPTCESAAHRDYSTLIGSTSG
jgi:hypothetical protein